MVLRRGGSVEPVVHLLADEIDAKGNEGDAKSRSGVAELIRQHRVLSPLVPSPEELSRGSQGLIRHFFSLLHCLPWVLLSPSMECLRSKEHLFRFKFRIIFGSKKTKFRVILLGKCLTKC